VPPYSVVYHKSEVGVRNGHTDVPVSKASNQKGR
jgi:hypothetical protein